MGRNSRWRAAQNREAIVHGAEAGKKQAEIADDLTITREHVNRTLAELRAGFRDKSPEAFSAYVMQQVELLTKAVEEVWEGNLPSDAANSIKGLMDSIARLTGSNAPTKSISASMTVNPEHSPEYLLFREAVAGLTDSQLHDVYKLAKAMPRVWVAPPMVCPEVKALTEGESDEA